MKSWLVALGATVLVFSALLFPRTCLADEPEPVHRYADDRKPPNAARTKLLLTGTALWGAFYLPALGASYLYPDHEGAEQIRIPVAGPWMGLGHTKLCNARPDLDNCSDFLQVFGAVLLAFDGIGQAGGVGLVLQSFFIGTKRAEAQASTARLDMGDDALLDGSPLTATLMMRSPTLAPSPGPLTIAKKDFSITPVPFVPSPSSVGFGVVGSF